MSDGEWVTLPMGKARREESGIVYVLIETHTPAPGDDRVQASVELIDRMKAELVPDGRAPMLIDAVRTRVARAQLPPGGHELRSCLGPGHHCPVDARPGHGRRDGHRRSTVGSHQGLLERDRGSRLARTVPVEPGVFRGPDSGWCPLSPRCARTAPPSAPGEHEKRFSRPPSPKVGEVGRLGRAEPEGAYPNPEQLGTSQFLFHSFPALLFVVPAEPDHGDDRP